MPDADIIPEDRLILEPGDTSPSLPPRYAVTRTNLFNLALVLDRVEHMLSIALWLPGEAHHERAVLGRMTFGICSHVQRSFVACDMVVDLLDQLPRLHRLTDQARKLVED